MSYIVTHTGRTINPAKLDPNKIHIEDIAYALSQLCRFTGHTNCFYSVAEHCVHASYLVPGKWSLAALLHDAHEAYMGDVNSILKQSLKCYQKLEADAMDIIIKKFRLPYDHHGIIKGVDYVLWFNELRDLLDFDPTKSERYEITKKVRHIKLVPPRWSSRVAKKLFLDRFYSLFEN